MKTLAVLAAAAIAFATPALAQQSTTTQRVLPNGDVRTSTTVHNGGMSPMGHRMDGRTVVSERVVREGNRGWHRGHQVRRVCKTRWHHGQRIRRCWTRRV